MAANKYSGVKTRTGRSHRFLKMKFEQSEDKHTITISMVDQVKALTEKFGGDKVARVLEGQDLCMGLGCWKVSSTGFPGLFLQFETTTELHHLGNRFTFGQRRGHPGLIAVIRRMGSRALYFNARMKLDSCLSR